MAHVGGNDWGPFSPDDELIDILKTHLNKPPSEEAIQETISFEDETIAAGKKYPLLVMPSGLFMFKDASGLFIFKDEVPPQEKSELVMDEMILFVPNKNKKSGKKIKMHPMTGVALKSNKFFDGIWNVRKRAKS
jgi:hypothetical protein